MFNQSAADLEHVLRSGNVERFHAIPGVSKQLNSSHSWGVATICLYLMPNCSRQLLVASLFHDCAERWTGDVPFHLKKYGNPEIKKLLDEEEDEWFEKYGIPIPEVCEEEKAVMKIADGLEGMQYCLYRLECGERGALEPWGNWISFLGEYIDKAPISSFVKERAFKLFDRTAREFYAWRDK